MTSQVTSNQSNTQEQTLKNDEEAVIAVLKGECPHNKGWTYHARYNDDVVYRCNLCYIQQSV